MTHTGNNSDWLTGEIRRYGVLHWVRSDWVRRNMVNVWKSIVPVPLMWWKSGWLSREVWKLVWNLDTLSTSVRPSVSDLRVFCLQDRTFECAYLTLSASVVGWTQLKPPQVSCTSLTLAINLITPAAWFPGIFWAVRGTEHPRHRQFQGLCFT